jgi:hypothetical protein
LNERTGNVYENKGSAKKANYPCPSLAKEGSRELPSSDEEGVGGGGMKNLGTTARLAGGLPGAAQRSDFSTFGNKARMSLKTNERTVIYIEKRTQNEHRFERENCKLMHRNSECEVWR